MRSLQAVTAFLLGVPLLSFAQELKLPDLWEYSAPLIEPEKRDVEPSHAQKDPTVVRHAGKWHVFMTVKLPDRSAIEYCSFEEWGDANASKRTLLKISESDYFCAPQVFYFEPHAKWYLVYQVGVAGSKKMWVAYSTTTDISNPTSWTKAQPMPGLDGGPNDPREVGGLDYWVICDEERAYLFLTSLNGKMWRLSTAIEDFPAGFGDWALALDAKIFEASHTYRLKGQDKFLTFIEEDGRRYFKAYIADRLDGGWKPLADTEERPFAGANNIRPKRGVDPWTDNVSHGELLRDSNDQRLVIDPDNLRLLFQGMLHKDKSGKGYGRYDWRLGLLTPAKKSAEERPPVSWVNPKLPAGPGLKHHVLESEAMGHDVGYVVATPNDYDASGKTRYPVVYFLHGMGGNESADAGGFSGLVRGATRAGKMPPAICVFPNGGRSGYRGEVEQMIVEELIPLIDQTYPTKAEAASRVVAGFSMGGAGSARLSLMHPDLFCGTLTQAQYDSIVTQIGSDWAINQLYDEVENVKWFLTNPLPNTGLAGDLKRVLQDSGFDVDPLN